MLPRRPKVLVVDDEEDTALRLQRVLYPDNDRFDVLLARSAEIAMEILADTPLEVIVTDMLLPGRSGMDLLCWAATERPDTRVIIMTSFELDGIRDRAHAFGCLRVMRKPLDWQELRSTVLQALDHRDGFAGTLSEISCIDVVQMLCLARKTTAIRFAGETGSGAVYIDHGEVVHATFGDLAGAEAFYRMVTVEKGAFHTAAFPVDVERTIDAPWQGLLMEGTIRLDEAARDRPIEVPALIDQGFAYIRSGRRDDARRAWEEALRLDPGNRVVEANLRKLGGAPAHG